MKALALSFGLRRSHSKVCSSKRACGFEELIFLSLDSHARSNEHTSEWLRPSPKDRARASIRNLLHLVQCSRTQTATIRPHKPLLISQGSGWDPEAS